MAAVLHEAGLATLRPDLLTPEEARDAETRFDIALLTEIRDELQPAPPESSVAVGRLVQRAGRAVDKP